MANRFYLSQPTIKRIRQCKKPRKTTTKNPTLLLFHPPSSTAVVILLWVQPRRHFILLVHPCRQKNRQIFNLKAKTLGLFLLSSSLVLVWCVFWFLYILLYYYVCFHWLLHCYCCWPCYCRQCLVAKGNMVVCSTCLIVKEAISAKATTTNTNSSCGTECENSASEREKFEFEKVVCTVKETATW